MTRVRTILRYSYPAIALIGGLAAGAYAVASVYPVALVAWVVGWGGALMSWVELHKTSGEL